MREWKDGMMNPGQLTQIIRCSVAWGGCHRSRPSVPIYRQEACGMETLAGGAGGFVSIPDGGLGCVHGFDDRRPLETRMRRRG